MVANVSWVILAVLMAFWKVFHMSINRRGEFHQDGLPGLLGLWILRACLGGLWDRQWSQAHLADGPFEGIRELEAFRHGA